jgi:hypothetical protein
LSAPVLDKYDRYQGIVDMLHIVTFVVELYKQSPSEKSAVGWTNFFRQEMPFREATVKTVMKKWAAAHAHRATDPATPV